MSVRLRQLALICMTQLRRLLSDPGTAIWLVGLPVALIGVLGMSLQALMESSFTPPRPYVVAVSQTGFGQASGEAYETVMGVFASYPDIVTAQTVADPATAQHMVLRREVDAAVVVSQGADGPWTYYAAPGAVVAGVLDEILPSVRIQLGERDAGHIDVVYTEVPLNEGVAHTGRLPSWLLANSYTYYAVGIAAMFVMFAAHSVMVSSAQDRASDAYARIRALGVTPAVFMLAGSVASVLVGILFLTLMATVSRVLFGVDWGNLQSWSVITVLAAVSSGGLAFALMAIVRGAEQVEGAGSAIFNVLAFLSGSMTPLHVLPEWFRTSLEWLPTRAVLAGYLKASQGADLAALAGEITTLLVGAAVLFGLGAAVWMLRTRREA